MRGSLEMPHRWMTRNQTRVISKILGGLYRIHRGHKCVGRRQVEQPRGLFVP